MKRIPIVMCIDIEPDERLIDQSARVDWRGFENTYDFFAKLRPQLGQATGSPVHLSWFLRMDPQIAHAYGSPSWAATRYVRLLQTLRAAGDELGLHTHAWRWDAPSQTWIADLGSQAWVDHCVRMSFDTFHRKFNQPCTSFRFGDHWMNNPTLDLVERLGARFDLTLEPGQPTIPTGMLKEPCTDSLPDYTKVPVWPYHPSPGDFRKQSVWRRRRIWMIPVSTGRTEGPKASRFRRLKHLARFIGIDRNWRGASPLNVAMSSPEFCHLLDDLLTIWRRPYLALVLRTDVGSNPADYSNLERSFEYLLSHPLVHRFAFATPSEAIAYLNRA